MTSNFPLGLTALPHGVEDIVEVDNTYHIVYHPVTVTDTQRRQHTIGPIRVEIRPALSTNHVAQVHGYLPPGQVHPHILLGEGSICMGNYRGGIMTAINEELWVTAIVLLGEILDSYNPKDCYNHLELPVACRFCQRVEVPQLTRCSACGTGICSDCIHPDLQRCLHCIVPCASCLAPAARGYRWREPQYCMGCIRAVYGQQTFRNRQALPRLIEELRFGLTLPLFQQWGISPSLRTKTAWQEHYRAFHGQLPNDWAMTSIIALLPKARVLAEVVPPQTTLTAALQEAEEGMLFEDDGIERTTRLSQNTAPILQNIMHGRLFLSQLLTPPEQEQPNVPVLQEQLVRRLHLASLYQWKERHQ